MKWLITLFLCLSAPALWAGRNDKKQLEAAVNTLDKALLAKDSAQLRTVLHRNVSYGHSNGWIETKQEVINDLFNGMLDYQQIKTVDTSQINVWENTGIVRSVISVTVAVEGKLLHLKLKVLQAWVYEKGKWQLLGRQSVKVD